MCRWEAGGVAVSWGGVEPTLIVAHPLESMRRLTPSVPLPTEQSWQKQAVTFRKHSGDSQPLAKQRVERAGRS